MAVQEYKLPDPGEGLTEAEIVTWRVKVGDVVKVNDVVVEIETAKSLVELPSPYAGTVTSILVPEGETVAVGTPIIVIGDPADATVAESPQPRPPEDAESSQPRAAQDDAAPTADAADAAVDLSNPSAGTSNATLVGYGPRSAAARRRARRSATPHSPAGTATQMQVQGAFTPGGDSAEVVAGDEEAVPAVEARADRDERPTRPSGAWHVGRVLAKPKVRRLARELGVDLAAVAPRGPDGVVTAEDVEAAAGLSGAAEAGEPTRERDVSAGVGSEETASRPGTLEDRREAIKGVRKMMGQAMVQSAFAIPHVTEWITVDATKTVALVSRLRDQRDFAGVRVSPLLVLAKAVCLAMRRTPEVNAHWDDEAQEIVFHGSVNLGIAAATPRGLVVPNVKGADGLPLPELGRQINALADTAREGRTQPAQMSGGTFTISNVGVFGVDAGTPIINPGESAIMAFGAVRKQPWVHKGTIKARDVTTLALSFDHRFIDGAKGSRFLADVAGILEDPVQGLRF